MNLKVPALLRFALTGAILLCPPRVALAQLPSLPSGKEKEEAAPPAETPEQARKRLNGWISEWRDHAGALAKPAALPVGVTADEAAARRTNALLGIFAAESMLRSLDTAGLLKESLAAAKERAAAWKGFDRPGPYSFVLHDELRRQREGVATRMAAYESAVAMLERDLSHRQDDIKKAEEALRRLQENAVHAGPAELAAATWRLDAARLQLKVLGASAAMLQQSRENTRIRISVAGADTGLLDRQVAALGQPAIFPAEDLARLRKSTDERAAAIAKDLSNVEATRHQLVAARQQALAAVEALKSGAVEATAEDKARLEEEEARLRSLDSETESLANRSEIISARMRFLGEYQDAQTSRRILLTSASADERADALENLQSQLARAVAFDSLIDVRRNATLSAIQEQEARMAAIDAGAPLRARGEKLLATYRQDLDAVERLGQEISSLQLDIGRWLGDSEELAKSMTWGERFRAIGSRLSGWAEKLWNFEVYRYDDRSEVEGQVITVKRGLVLGWLLGALLFFYAAYLAGSWLLKRAFKRLVATGRVEHGQAQTLRRWTRIAMAIALALFTLHLLKIPLAAFAFLGGALAIGVGFGTQTLFKNFISGIIVLAERKVRVGDILDVDGIAGTVTSIDTRSSTVRTFDGVEIILPNALLLENKVTNWTHDTPLVRRVVKVGVPHGSPLRQVSSILAECAEEHGVIVKSPGPQVVLEDFAADSLVFALYFWIDLRGKSGAMVVASDLRFMIERRLAEAGIALSSPPRELHLNTGKPLQVSLAEAAPELGKPPA